MGCAPRGCGGVRRGRVLSDLISFDIGILQSFVSLKISHIIDKGHSFHMKLFWSFWMSYCMIYWRYASKREAKIRPTTAVAAAG